MRNRVRKRKTALVALVLALMLVLSTPTTVLADEEKHTCPCEITRVTVEANGNTCEAVIGQAQYAGPHLNGIDFKFDVTGFVCEWKHEGQNKNYEADPHSVVVSYSLDDTPGSYVDLTADGSTEAKINVTDMMKGDMSFTIDDNLIPDNSKTLFLRFGLRDDSGSADRPSYDAKMKLVFGDSSDLSFSQNPQNVTVTEGKNAVFTAEARGSSPATYQWQRSVDNGASWTNIAGATDNSLTVKGAALIQNGYQYRCLATNNEVANLPSGAAILTVQETGASNPTSITEQTPPPNDPSTNPETGDSSNNVVLWGLLLLASALGIAAVLFRRKRRLNEDA